MTSLLHTRAELDRELAVPRVSGATLGLVPTMGFLHDGHVALLRAARERCETVVMSLFVNPAQFGPGEDLEAYPRDLERDLELAQEAGVEIVYAPAVEDVYPPGFATTVDVGEITEVLDGDPARRGPAHFRGVTTVVAKLFNTVRPDLAFFGQKDAQQALVIKRMVRDLDFGIEIVVVPTVREPDGLAMSSRNTYLSPDERERASAINRALRAIEDAVRAGEVDAGAAIAAGLAELGAAGIEPEYLEARDAETLAPIEASTAGPCGGRRRAPRHGAAERQRADRGRLTPLRGGTDAETDAESKSTERP